MATHMKTMALLKARPGKEGELVALSRSLASNSRSEPGIIQETNVGKVVIFGGGIPVTLNGSIVGAVGASAGTVEQDVAVAEAAIAALGPEISEVRRQHREGIPT